MDLIVLRFSDPEFRPPDPSDGGGGHAVKEETLTRSFQFTSGQTFH